MLKNDDFFIRFGLVSYHFFAIIIVSSVKVKENIALFCA
ncbi:hypothetical protein RV15_GL000920 [Enterococcus silesiacus]|uniref:Uncharacterized protein n=1 Tax=Enterococcus silesiacus TaxID=332949 RepID=A0AA91JNT6_9ENTE|nr:hypothetical protein RV15_GL000920 [Enterococcus silesiacus]